MKNILFFSLVLGVISSPAFAQAEKADAAAPATPPEATAPAAADAAVTAAREQIPAETLKLAREMHEVWPMRIRIERILDSIAEEFPPDKVDVVKATLRKSMKFDQLEEESIKAMATTYTADELRAMIAFYSSPEGRSVSTKTAEYEEKITPTMRTMVDKAMLDLKLGLQK